MKDPLVIIAGPTATGKSRTAVELCRRLDGAVISADSMQVYRGMDIGSAKITEDEMKGVSHYLIDVADPRDSWNVVRFQKEAKEAADEILRQKKIPFLVGGTGFYIQALLYGIDFTKMPTDSGYRQKLEERDSSALWKELDEKDPKAAAAIHPNNKKRIIRALEFYELSGGQKISDHNERQRQKEPAWNSVFFVLTMDRAKLYARCDARVDDMMRDGLLEECKKLRDMGLTSSDVSMQGLGYKQILRYLEGDFSLDEAIRLIKRDTRHFAKRQLTWFRREKDVIWVDRDNFQNEAQMYDEMERIIRDELGLRTKESGVKNDGRQ